MRWTASRSLSSGAHSRDPLARNDGNPVGWVERSDTHQRRCAWRRVSLRSTHRTINTHLRSRGALRPRFDLRLPPLKLEGAGKTGCALHPRSRVPNAQTNAHEHTGSAGTLRPSLRNGFTAYFVLSPVNGSFATVALERLASQELDASTAASGPHDFAVRFTPPSSVMASASTATCPNVRDDGQRPSSGTGWRQFSFDLPDGLSGIFLREGLDRFFS